MFYTDNITSTLTIVVFSINWSRMFALYVRRMCCKLELKTLNTRKTTASLWNHRKCRVCSDPCICITQRYSSFFSSKVLHEIWRIFPRSFDIVVISDVPTSYLIFCTKQTRKQSFLSSTSATSRDLSRMPSSSRPQGVSLFRNIERCVVVSFNGPTYIHESDVEHALCAFSGVYWEYFQVFRRFGCAKWKYCEKWHFPAPKIWNLFFLYLAEYSVKYFITTRQYLVNLTCNCWFGMCTQFHQKLDRYKCMLFVDCLVVLREYFVNWARATKFQFFFLKYFYPESYVRCHVCHTTVVVTWLLKFNRRFPEITGKDNLTVFSYSRRVKSPEWRRQLRRADLRQF